MRVSDREIPRFLKSNGPARKHVQSAVPAVAEEEVAAPAAPPAAEKKPPKKKNKWAQMMESDLNTKRTVVEPAGGIGPAGGLGGGRTRMSNEPPYGGFGDWGPTAGSRVSAAGGGNTEKAPARSGGRGLLSLSFLLANLTRKKK